MAAGCGKAAKPGGGAFAAVSTGPAAALLLSATAAGAAAGHSAATLLLQVTRRLDLLTVRVAQEPLKQLERLLELLLCLATLLLLLSELLLCRFGACCRPAAPSKREKGFMTLTNDD